MFAAIWAFLTGAGGQVMAYLAIAALVVGGYFYWQHSVQQAALNQAEVIALKAAMVQQAAALALQVTLTQKADAALSNAQKAQVVLETELGKVRAQINGGQFTDRPARPVIQYVVGQMQANRSGKPTTLQLAAPVKGVRP